MPRIVLSALAVAALAAAGTVPALAQQKSGDSMMSKPAMPSAMQSGTPSQPMHDANTVRRVQEKLHQAGYDVGPVDGILGSRTSTALRKYQESNGLETSGTLTASTLDSLGLSAGGASMGSAISPSSASPGTDSQNREPSSMPGRDTMGTTPALSPPAMSGQGAGQGPSK